jgi:hypothetical protein
LKFGERHLLCAARAGTSMKNFTRKNPLFLLAKSITLRDDEQAVVD